ncbi:TRAP transporter small permease [Betaproteobacteria bacterium PRO7]|nr:TRAP transporter small permease [Betaproteobacteria bacterium PRO7]
MKEPTSSRAMPADAFGRALQRACELFALAGGLVFVALTLLVTASILGRWLIAKAVPGDYELMQLGCAVGVAAFLPWCQLRGGHVIVDFFTARAGPRLRAVLDALGAALLAGCSALVAGRMVDGARGLAEAGETTTVLAVPIWVPVALMVPSFALLAVAGAYTAWRHTRAWRE